MPKKLLIVNALLIAIAAGSTAYIARQLAVPMPMPVLKDRPGAAATTSPVPVDDTRGAGAGAYNTVATRNLFSPTRSEAPPTTGTASASPAVKPNLFGVVLREGAPIAYLEDPTTKRVAGYRVGDNVAGGTVQTISADTVVINRPDGKLDVRLRDPARPRPASVPAAAGLVPGGQVGQPGVPVAPMPGVIPPVASPGVTPAPGVPVLPQQPGVAQPTVPGMLTPQTPGRRPLPPNLLRRLPQGAPSDATQQ
jgi:hypothetical protein